MARMDITERLDRIGRGEHLDLADIVCRDAKAEIERLREYVASYRYSVLSSQQVIEVGQALLPYLRNDLRPEELGTAAHDAATALRRAAPHTATERGEKS